MAPMREVTLRQIREALGMRTRQGVDYWRRKAKVTPIRRVGTVDLYDREAIDKIRRARG